MFSLPRMQANYRRQGEWLLGLVTNGSIFFWGLAARSLHRDLVRVA